MPRSPHPVRRARTKGATTRSCGRSHPCRATMTCCLPRTTRRLASLLPPTTTRKLSPARLSGSGRTT